MVDYFEKIKNEITDEEELNETIVDFDACNCENIPSIDDVIQLSQKYNQDFSSKIQEGQFLKQIEEIYFISEFHFQDQ